MAEITLTRLKRETLLVQVRGTAPLIVHAWDQKARQMMLAKQQGKKAPKLPKDPIADFEASQYRFEDGRHGFPTTAFKQATVKGGQRAFGKAVKMTELRQHLFFEADGIGRERMPLSVLDIETEPEMREDMVRVGMGTADLRYRAHYFPWSVLLRVTFLPSVIDDASVVALIDAGGANGIGEWRPEKSGNFGTYEVAS
jgi:hypothetical protein